ncbi:MAG: DUF4954 domain-containing protein, partial [Phycisphaerae bacterium]
LQEMYPLERTRHAMAVLCELHDARPFGIAEWQVALDELLAIQRYICNEVSRTRRKDDENPFRSMVYRCTEEMAAVVGTVADNNFVLQTQQETEELEKKVEEIRRRS